MIEWLEGASNTRDASEVPVSNRLRRANTEFRGGMYERALATLDFERIELSPAGHALRSDILAALGRREEALADARTAWQARPERTDLSLRVATRLVEADRAGEAVAVLLEALEVPSAAERILAGVAALDLKPSELGLLYEASRAVALRRLASTHEVGERVQTRDEIVGTMRKHVASWTGTRRTLESAIVGRNENGTRSKLFWCCQAEFEFARLATELGEDRPVYAMRSGHLIIGYADEEVTALASAYARELMEIQPEGSFQLGGNCQGAFLARATALILRKAGRDVSKLILMEESTFFPFEGAVALIFGRDSTFNPLRCGRTTDDKFARAYPCGYTLDFIDGTHGEFFTDENVKSLTAVLARLLTD